MISADFTGIGAYIGAVGGVLSAVEDARFKGDFVEHLIDEVGSHFKTETIAAKARVPHVFEWGAKQGEISDIPLFELTRGGTAGNRVMGYRFLPSNRFVPLPDPNRYGINPEKLTYLRRHTFQLKALVMETQSEATIVPQGPSGRLFIPTGVSEETPQGYIMTTKPVTINPGGEATTGAFALWWNEWFAARGQAIVTAESQKTQQWLVATGEKYVRYAAGTVVDGRKVGGQFARGKNVSTSFINATEQRVKERVLESAREQFDEAAWEAQWDD